MLALEAREVFAGHLIVVVAIAGLGHVDDDRGAHEPIERNRVDGLTALREMYRRIDMRATVLEVNTLFEA